MKKLARYCYMRMVSALDYISDFNQYMKYNYNNPFRNDQKALLAKMLRQTHTIEKGMSICEPRVGFGVAKINELMKMVDRYISLSYDMNSTGFLNAVSAMTSYKKFQEKMGYVNKALFDKIDKYEKLVKNCPKSGIQTIPYNELMKRTTGNFEQFMMSRHSIRQFADTEVDTEKIKKAINLAKHAPTACNRQGYKVYLYDSDSKTIKLGEIIAGNTGFKDDVKRYLIVTGLVSSFYDSFERNQVYVEAGIFTMALAESLHYYGIANCVLQNGEHRKKQKKFRALCHEIGKDEKIIAFIAIGNYKDDVTYAISNRKRLDEILEVIE